MKHNLILASLLILSLNFIACDSCKQDGKTLKTYISEVPETGRVNQLIDLERLKGPIPYPCSLISKEMLATTMGLDINTVELKEGTDPNATEQRACFFKWTDPNYPNAAVLVQVMKNPIADEYDNWVKSYIDSKKSLGEKSMYGDSAERFLPFNDLGDSGAASFVLKKFYWELNNELVFLIAYNVPSNNENQLKEWTLKFGVEIMTNYNKL